VPGNADASIEVSEGSGQIAIRVKRDALAALGLSVADIQLSLPYLLFVVAIVGILGPSLRNVVLVFGVAEFPLFARMARGETLRLRSAPFVEAAVASGASGRFARVRARGAR